VTVVVMLGLVSLRGAAHVSCTRKTNSVWSTLTAKEPPIPSVVEDSALAIVGCMGSSLDAVVLVGYCSLGLVETLVPATTLKEEDVEIAAPFSGATLVH